MRGISIKGIGYPPEAATVFKRASNESTKHVLAALPSLSETYSRSVSKRKERATILLVAYCVW